MLGRFFKPDPIQAAARGLYDHVVVGARRPALYGPSGARDTVDGRFDLLVLHAALLMRRLREGDRDGQAVAQKVFDIMFDDMDAALREMGAGDLSVGKKIRAMAEAFYGAARAYDAALATGDRAALETAIARNLFDEAAERQAAAAFLADVALEAQAGLAGQSPQALIEGAPPRWSGAEAPSA